MLLSQSTTCRTAFKCRISCVCIVVTEYYLEDCVQMLKLRVCVIVTEYYLEDCVQMLNFVPPPNDRRKKNARDDVVDDDDQEVC